MKRLLRSLLLGAILSALLCVGVLAADSESVKGGIYNIKSSNVTLKPNTEATTDTVDGTEYTDYYANAVKFEVKAEKLAENQQYLLLVLKGGADGSAPGVPTADNIAYIDQMAAQNGSVSFTAYPKELTKGTYYVYLVGAGKTFAESKVATFQCDQRYTLGDVNEDGVINTLDALAILQNAAELKTLTDAQKLAADVAKPFGMINTLDALRVLQYAAGIIPSF
mgnify:CR=1 FL=1